MKRFTVLAATLLLVAGTIGCHHNCNQCAPHGVGAFGCAGCQGHDGCNTSTGCRACKLGWQHGGHDYSEGLATHNPLHGFPGRQSRLGGGAPPDAYGAAGAGAAGYGGAPTAGVAYPYYTVRGPRDFLLDNPPSIGH